MQIRLVSSSPLNGRSRVADRALRKCPVWEDAECIIREAMGMIRQRRTVGDAATVCCAVDVAWAIKVESRARNAEAQGKKHW
jgi:hypothetical protein